MTKPMQLLVALATVTFPLFAAAQPASWPARAVRIVATIPPGGSVDLLAETDKWGGIIRRSGARAE